LAEKLIFVGNGTFERDCDEYTLGEVPMGDLRKIKSATKAVSFSNQKVTPKSATS
jgi:hypothetical protein